MNIAVVPGTSSEQARILARYGLFAAALRRDDRRAMDLAFDAYCRGGDDRWSREEFVAQADLYHFGVFREDPPSVECVFGLEFCYRADPGPHWWVEFCYFAEGQDAPRGVLKRSAPAVVEICHWCARRWCHEAGQQAVLRLTGRRGWSRILRSLHIERDELGFIFENQERFRHGLQ